MPYPTRQAKINRRTRETQIQLTLRLDGRGKVQVDSSIPFLDHMLELWTFHGGFDLTLRARGDREVDDHHLVEDLGIALGDAIHLALGTKQGITRYGQFLLPMDEALSYVALDLSGRTSFVYRVKFPRRFRGRFDFDLLEHFFQVLADHARLALHIRLLEGRNAHHIAESLFKGLGRALRQAVERDPRRRGVPSTKGVS
ncbi:MAG: imidazoleglycerol-phosphate dehydratase HisB [Elusimicrobia bacterium]|nr:imidazoleglycerol-phosphate dehydratase HisB [Elusimicrobiota bacterium]